MNHELQAEIEQWRNIRRKLELLAKERAGMYGIRPEETPEGMICNVGFPTACEYSKVSFHVTPKLIDEVDFLNRVVGGLVDDMTAAQTVQDVMRENELLRRSMEEVLATTTWDYGPNEAMSKMRKIATEALKNLR